MRRFTMPFGIFLLVAAVPARAVAGPSERVAIGARCSKKPIPVPIGCSLVSCQGFS